MTSKRRRVELLESELTPKQAMLLWLQDFQRFATIEDYVEHLKSEPRGARPLYRLSTQVSEAVKTALKGKPINEINRAVRLSVRDVLFLFILCRQLNFWVLEERRYLWTQARLMATELAALQNEQTLHDQRTLDWMRFAKELPYPLDPEMASAVAAAEKHQVLTWEALEESGTLDEWLLSSFVAEGRTTLPGGAYLSRDGIRSNYYPLPSPDEVRDRFKDDDSFQKFSDGEDISYGLADTPDAEYEKRYEELVTAVKRVARPGKVVDLPTTPHDFLREAPLVDGEWIDGYVVKLADWGERISDEGYVLDDPEPGHHLAMCRIVDPKDRATVPDITTRELLGQTTNHLSNFPGSTEEINGRPYLRFTDYLEWKGRETNVNLNSTIQKGIVVSDWNEWVDDEGGEGATILAGVKVGKLSCSADRPSTHVFRDADELVIEVNRRESLLTSLRPNRPGDQESECFKQRVGDSKDLSEGLLTELYTIRKATEIIGQRYFDGQQVLFGEEAERAYHLVALLEGLTDVYNEDLASRLEDQQRLLSDAGSKEQELGLITDPTGVIGKIDSVVNDRVACIVDMAKAEAHRQTAAIFGR